MRLKNLGYFMFIVLISILFAISGCDSGGGIDLDSTSDTTKAPSVTTLDASSVESSSAKLGGNVNSNGLSTTYHFEYGTTTNYEYTTTATDAGSGTTDVSVSADLTELFNDTTYHFRLVATNSKGTSQGDDKTFKTLVPISIYNKSPTYKTAFSTYFSPVTISGMGNGPISAITWKNSTTGQIGNCTGTTSWSAEIPLQEGDNEIEITASPSSGSESVTITLKVTYNSLVNFTSLPQLSPDVGIAGQTYDQIFVRVGISSTNLDATSVKVYNVDDSGYKVGAELGSLRDDGNLSNGDEIEGDGIYSSQISLASTEAGAVKMRVFASSTNGTEAKTGAFSFKFFPQPTTEQITQQSTNNDLAAAKFNDLFSSLSSNEVKVQSLDDMVSYLKGLTGVLEAGKGAHGVWWLNEAGMLCEMSWTDFENEENLAEASMQSDVQTYFELEELRYGSGGYDPRSTQVEYLKTRESLKASGALMYEEEDDDKYEIGSSNAIHISPYKQVTSWYASNSGGTGWLNVVDITECPIFSKTERINNTSDPQSSETAQAPLSAWKSLSNFGLISTLSHGDSFDIVKKKLEEKYPLIALFDWLFPWHNKRVVFHSNILIDFTAEGLADYLVDILAGRLMLFPSGDGKVKLVITPEFISHYNGTFPNSIWYSMSCRSAYNDTMAAVFLAKGGGAYFGFSDYVLARYAFNTQRTVFEKLIKEGKNSGEAFDAAKASHGANDGQASNPAAFVFYGEKKTKIGDSEPKNTSFEDPDGAGSLNGWNKSGDGRAIKILGVDSPTDGGTMAIISTGLGFTTKSGSIYQSFCLPEDAKNLVFDWNFYSEEFKEYCNSMYDDKFRVSIIDIETGTETILFSTSVNILCANKDALIDSPVNFDQGDAWYTGWRLNKTVDISAYKGKAVTLKFFATDIGDSIYDTAILIDDIRITK